MATNKLPNMTANVTEQTEDLWSRFIGVHRSLGLSRTKALEQAAALWLDANTDPAGQPWRHNPFRAGPAPVAEPEPEWLPAIPVPESVIPSGLPEDPEPQGPVYQPPTHNPFA